LHINKQESQAEAVRDVPWAAAKTMLAGGFVPRLLLWLLPNVLVVVLAVWALHESRLKYEERATVEVQNLAQLLDHDISASMRSIDLALQATVMEVERQSSAGQLNAQALNLYLEQQLFLHPDLDGLRVADAQGLMTHGTGVNPANKLSIADRDYFARLRTQADTGMVIGRPVQGRISGKWATTVSRAIKHPDGSFAGVVVGAVPLSRFTRAFAALALGKGGSFTLFDDDMRIVIRHPDGPDAKTMVGMKFGSPALLNLVHTGVIEGTYQAVSTIDGVNRVFAYRKVRGVPLNIVTGLATEESLAGWRQEAVKAGVLVVLFVLVTLLLFWVTYRAWKNQAVAVAALQDINRSLDAEKQLNQTIIQSSPFAIYTRDSKGIVTAWNKASEMLFGWRADEIVGKPLLSVPPGKETETEDLRQRVLRGENLIQMEVQRQKRDGTLFDLSTTLAPLRNKAGEIDGYLAIATDITERKVAEKQIEFLAYRDVLTGLPNRLLLRDRFEQAIAHADRSGTQVALLFLDLDNFKSINDSLGHVIGDALLKEVARRLGECVRETDTISRQGGDEFLIVLPDMHGADAVTPVLLKIRERVQSAFEVDGHELSTSTSIGIALYPGDGKDFQTLMQKADTAMYRAKDGGRNSYRFFDEQMNVEAVEHLHIKTGLRRALARDEFVLHYQPQIDLGSGAVVGVEALIRWNHPEQGLIAPARFIPVAEESGLIVPIGEWVIHEACRQGVAWREAGLPPLLMAVNLSAVQFKRGDVEQTVIRALQETGFGAHLLELELTESILIHDTDNVLATVKRLKQLGVKLSIDDFGTGYSSLSYLKRFDVDKLKIDQSFVRDLASDPEDEAIIRAIIQMARSLNLKTIAEGVEDAGMVLQLRQFNCDEAQGYHFARPMAAHAMADFLAQKRSMKPTEEWSI
jgi:diguanylate cyclase (GGDEF)-like protein/PAS domain S-box-containing protein